VSPGPVTADPQQVHSTGLTHYRQRAEKSSSAVWQQPPVRPMARAQSAGLLQQQQRTLHQPCACSAASTLPRCCMCAQGATASKGRQGYLQASVAAHVQGQARPVCMLRERPRGTAKGPTGGSGCCTAPRIKHTNHQNDRPPRAGAATRHQKVAACSCVQRREGGVQANRQSVRDAGIPGGPLHKQPAEGQCPKCQLPCSEHPTTGFTMLLGGVVDTQGHNQEVLLHQDQQAELGWNQRPAPDPPGNHHSTAPADHQARAQAVVGAFGYAAPACGPGPPTAHAAPICSNCWGGLLPCQIEIESHPCLQALVRPRMGAVNKG
jgi:hypothetical protein